MTPHMAGGSRRIEEPFTRILGGVFMVVGVLVIIGEWPPGA